MDEFILKFAALLWGPPTMILIFAVGLLFSIQTRFFQIRKLDYILKNTLFTIFEKKEEKPEEEGEITAFQAMATALSGTVGNANMAGVATAIFIGGPGAVFWMWLVAIFGMITKLVEVSLAVHYREKDEDGNFYGGPMYYIEKGLGENWKPLAKFFALMMVIGGLGTAVFVQPHTMSAAMKNIFNVPPVVTVITTVTIAAVVIIGGVKRIGSFCEKITPTMCALYILASLGILIVNFKNIPEAFRLIFVYAFNPMSAMGGFTGSTIILAMQRGISRGVFSNEAGMGSAPIVHATAKTDHPIRQGMFGSFEVFIDTIVVCTMTALVILSSGTATWTSGLNGIDLTMSAFAKVYGPLGNWIVGICVLLFAFSTMIGWAVEFETSFVYIFGKKSKMIAKVIYLIPPFFTLGKTTEMIWTIVDIAVGIEVIPNVIALIMLRKVFKNLMTDFEENKMKVELKEKEKELKKPIVE